MDLLPLSFVEPLRVSIFMPRDHRSNREDKASEQKKKKGSGSLWEGGSPKQVIALHKNTEGTEDTEHRTF